MIQGPQGDGGCKNVERITRWRGNLVVFFLHLRDEEGQGTEGIDLRSEEPTGAYWMSKKAWGLDMMGED